MKVVLDEEILRALVEGRTRRPVVDGGICGRQDRR